MDDWVSIDEDLPQLMKGYKRCSIAIDVLTESGAVLKNAFCTLDDEEFYDSNGKRIHNVMCWRTM